MAPGVKVPGGGRNVPLGHLVFNEDGAERRVPIFDQLFVGRECRGISEARRLVIRDPEISRTHLEIRLDAAADEAFVIDTSSNGTSLNGARLERAFPQQIKPGDEIRIGDIVLTFQSDRFTAIRMTGPRRTRERISQVPMVMVVGDIVNYSTISQTTDGAVMARSLDTLWHQLGGVLSAFQGTLSHYTGDKLFAIWEQRRLPDAAEMAIDFALAANQLVEQAGPELPLRDPDDRPIHMGWGVVQGMAALAAMRRSTDAVIGDAANVAFRLAELAGRDGRAPVMVTGGVQLAAEGRFMWGQGERVQLKGRRGTETVYPVIGRSHHVPASGR